jgi:hypothetical protein
MGKNQQSDENCLGNGNGHVVAEVEMNNSLTAGQRGSVANKGARDSEDATCWKYPDRDPLATLVAAADFAARKHRDQRRKNPAATPYINHPIGKYIVSSLTRLPEA